MKRLVITAALLAVTVTTASAQIPFIGGRVQLPFVGGGRDMSGIIAGAKVCCRSAGAFGSAAAATGASRREGPCL